MNVLLTGEIPLITKNIIPSIYFCLRCNIALSKYLLQYVFYIFMALNERESENMFKSVVQRNMKC